ncbi:MAG TPA: DUF5937 family protein, partial [Phototrophicaceae bacterium]|nr:DUF5937 family protein [Phototrophicaceae bacterium]
LDISPEDLHSTRFAYSPLLELSASYKVVKSDENEPYLNRWVEAAAEALRDQELPYLETLIPPHGYIPDFMTPTPTRTDLTFEAELQKLLNTPTRIIQDNIQALMDMDGETETRMQYMTYPREMLLCLVEDLRIYWQRAIEPHWSQLSSILEGDILYRARQLAIEGATKVYADLSPRLVLDHYQIQITKDDYKKHHSARHDISGRGLQLVPTAFMSCKIWWQVTPEWLPMLIYGARGIGQWQQQAPVQNQSLELLMGAGRASVLLALDTPASTSELAHRLMMTAGAVSQHLDRLHKTGLVEPHRSGKRVYYHLSQRGQQLLTLFA